MIFSQFYDTDLAQGSYLIACEQSREAVVVDPRRDVQEYLAEAERRRLTITAVTETHIHADYLSGARELAEATGARLLLSAEGGPDWLYRFPHEPLKHGDRITAGNVELTALHTPGHTPEHLSFLVRDMGQATEPGFMLTGDFVFVGDVGRPDLLDEVQAAEDSRFPAARRLFASLRDQFLSQPDWLQVWPGHGAGSACGKALGSVASTTVGYERRFAWWAPYLETGDEEGFVNELLAGQPDAPRYFGRMKKQNRAGPDLLGDLPRLREFSAPELAAGSHQLVDTRPRAEYNQGSAAGALHIPAGAKFVTYASYVLDPDTPGRPLVLLAGDAARAEELRQSLLRVGIDNVAGFITSLDGLQESSVPQLQPEALEQTDDFVLLDVRTASEHEGGSIPGASQISAGQVLSRLEELQRDKPLIVHCQSGARATLVASALRLKGFDARELIGNYPGWLEWQRQKLASG